MLHGIVTILDQTPSGNDFSVRRLEIAGESITVRELIRRRVREEWRSLIARSLTVFHGLVQPIETEQMPDGYRLKERRQLSWENQYEKALHAFEKNGVFVIVDGRGMSFCRD